MPIGPCIIIILEFFSVIIIVQWVYASYYSRHDPALPHPSLRHLAIVQDQSLFYTLPFYARARPQCVTNRAGLETNQ